MECQINRLRSRWILALIPLIGFAWFWLFRSNQWSGGDSEYWERMIHDGQWLRRRQMLSFAVIQAVHQLTNHLAGWNARLAMNFTSCLAGSVALLLAWMLVRDRSRPVTGFMIFATGGFTTVFYGHIETYALPMAALLFHLLAIRRVLERCWSVCTLPLTFSLVMSFHLIILFALPAAVFVCLTEGRIRRLDGRGWMQVTVSSIPILIIWWIVGHTNLGTGELVGPHMIGEPWTEILGSPSLLLTQPWFYAEGDYVKWKYVFWNGGLAGIVGALSLLKNSRGGLMLLRWRPFVDSSRHVIDGRYDFHLLLYFACFAGHFLVWRPSAWWYDFDLFSFPFMLACLAVGLRPTALPRLKNCLVIAMCGVMLSLLVWRPGEWWQDLNLFTFLLMLTLLGVILCLLRAPPPQAWLIMILTVNAFLFVIRPLRFSEIGSRDTGTILIQAASGVTEFKVLMDEWMRLDSENHYIPVGEHRIRSYISGWRDGRVGMDDRILLLDVKPDTVYTLRLSRVKMEVVNQSAR